MSNLGGMALRNSLLHWKISVGTLSTQVFRNRMGPMG